MQKTPIKNPVTICRALKQKHHQDNTLFSKDNMPCYWKSSELAFLYPNIFDMSQPISQTRINALDTMITNHIPEFKDLYPKPVHILNVKETYTIQSDTPNLSTIVKNGLNQNLSRIACEYIFGQFDDTEIEQAYFLFPDQTPEEIADFAELIRLERIRDQVAQSCKSVSSAINHTYGITQDSFNSVWALIWCSLYDKPTMNALRETYNIKYSPVNYMTPEALNIVNQMLTEIVAKYENTNTRNITTINYIARNTAIMARNRFIERGLNLYTQLSTENTRSKVDKVRRIREKFWRNNYKQSLLQK